MYLYASEQKTKEEKKNEEEKRGSVRQHRPTDRSPPSVGPHLYTRIGIIVAILNWDTEVNIVLFPEL
ncbi:unnamed protein product [Acanthoscelides obtectus]|uniref:Uncharacterized protein n=1 Tax=Acanthoscelides obtectus TaxID=200917 RepID=A0A9P0LWG3_ACAOB|nr:unnamed protein product [Acanthoscelides obtectus]CAK1684656.1 hypothetical protein AOBTE_LOCUS35002 [Acanthoscelides obtectus]